MGKIDIDVRPVNIPTDTPAIDWNLLKDDQTTRDMMAHMERQQEYRLKAMMGNWSAPRQDTELIISKLTRDLVEVNPLVEILYAFLNRVEGPYSWLWGDEDGRNGKRNLARLEMNGYEDHSGRGDISVVIRGHGDGEAFINTHTWPLSGRTRRFIHLLNPLIREIGCGDDLLFRLEYKLNHHRTSFKPYPSDVDLLGISLVVGGLMVFCDFRDKDDFDAQCDRIDHSVFHVRDKRLKIKNAREALFICNKNETMFLFRLKDCLKDMMSGDSPSEEEFLLMEMAGYKDEFWLDNIEAFDTLKIKPFNIMEQVRWYEQTIPRYRF